MAGKHKIRKINFNIAREEKVAYSGRMSPEERIKYLQHLRKINLGPSAETPLKKIVILIPVTKRENK
jgi:hypothetical protein